MDAFGTRRTRDDNTTKPNRFAQFLTEAEQRQDDEKPPTNRFAQFVDEPTEAEEPKGRSIANTARDISLSAAQGAARLPESIVGLGDLALTPFRERFNEVTGMDVGTMTEGLADAGVDFGRSREILGDMKSDGSRQAREDINAAFNEGMLSGLGELASNPASIAEGVVESVPQMIGAAGVVRMGAMRIFANAESAALANGATAEAARQAAQQALKAAAPRLATLSAGLEGAQVAGTSAAEYAADGELGGRQAAGSGAQGVSTGLITMVLNRFGARLGLEDVEAALGAGSANRSLGSRVARGAVREGPLEEGLQSTSETAISNITDGRPTAEGLGQSYVEGSVMGTPLGAGGAALSRPMADTASQAGDIDAELEALSNERLAEADQVIEQAEEQSRIQARADRGREEDAAAEVGAQVAAAAGGDSLSQLIAGENARRAKSDEIGAREELARVQDGGIDALSQARTDQAPSPDPIAAEIERADNEGRDTDAVRLRNAQKLHQAASRMEQSGRQGRAEVFRNWANRIVSGTLGRNLPQPAVQTGTLEVAERATPTVPDRQPLTIDQQVPRLDAPAAPNIIYGQEPGEVTERRERMARSDQIAREGVIEPGQRPRMPAPVVEEVETEVVTDEDYRANLDGDSVFTVGDTNSNATLEIVRDLTSDPEGARSRFGMEMDVVTMSPEEYIQRATELRAQSDQTTAEFERTKRESRTDKIDDIAQKMRDGETFAAPSLDMAGEGFVQDGLHRAMAAQQLGIPRIPVSIVRDAVPDTPAAEAHQAEGADALAESTPEETAPPAPEVAAEEAPEQATPEPEAVVEPETAEVRPEAEEAPAETQQSEDPGTPARGPEEVGATAEPATASRGSLQDVGEKIGAARKDTSTQTGRAKRAQPKSDQPAWRRRFSVSEIVAGSDKGKFAINDSRQRKNLFRRGGPVFETQEDAEAAIPLFAVAQKHRVRSVQGSDGRVFEIWRTINNRKMVKVVDQQFDDREAANLYMAKNAAQIIETNTTFGEADLPKPDDLNREGPERRTGDVDGEKVMETFGLRAVEFGNWNNQDERQEAVNAAYDGLADLADILGIPAKAIGLNGDLALAFGARGHGLSGAKAHYEPQRAVINLTKMRGAGSLAYEWFHALDHYFDRIDKKNRPQWQTEEDGTRTLADRGFATEGLNPSGNVRPEIREALINIVQTMKTKAVEYVEETQNVDHFVGRAREDLAGQLQRLRNHLADELRYRKRNSKPASAEQLAEFDRIADTLLAGESLTTEIRSVEDGSRRRGVMAGMRLTNDALDGLSAILKKVRGTTGFRADGVGLLDSLRSPMTRYNQRLKQMADAQAGETKIKRVPTDFSMNARELDQGRGENYWTTTIEMAARAFQGYVEDRVADQGGRSPFLNFGPENAAIITPWGFKRPFPAGEERQAINEAFDAFVEKLKTRETETGVALFRSKDAPGQGSTVGQVSQYIDGMPEQLLDRVRVVQSIEDVPDSARDEMRRQGATAISGFFERDSQSVWLVADGIRNKRSAQATLLHESVGHRGIEAVMGDQIFDFLKMVEGARDTDPVIGDAYRRVDRLYSEASPLIKASEVVANISEGNPKHNLLQRVYQWFRQTLRKMGFDVLFTNGDIIEALRRAKDAKIPESGQEGAALSVRPVSIPEVERPARSFADARKSVSEFRGQALHNNESGINAVVTRNALDKMLSRSAVDSSTNPQAHAAVVANLDTLFPDAVLGWSKPDDYGSKNIRAIHRFFAPTVVDGTAYMVKMTVKEVAAKNSPNPLYSVSSVELSERENPAVIWVGEQANADRVTGAQTRPAGLSVEKMAQAVEEFNSNVSLSVVDDRGFFSVPDETRAEAIVRKVQDQFLPLKRLQKAIRDAGGEVNEENDAYLAEELFHGRAENELRIMREDLVKPLAEKMAEYGVTHKELDQFVYALHAPERNAHIASINEKMPDGGSGMTDRQAGAILARTRKAGKMDQMRDLARMVQKITERRRELILEGSLEDDGTLAAWQSKYLHYVPLKGFADDTKEQGIPRTGQGFNIRGRESQRAMGRSTEAASPTSYAILDLTETIILAEKNVVGNALLKLVEDNPNPEYWEIFTEDDPEVARKIVKRRDPETGEIVERVEDRAMNMWGSDDYFMTKRDGKAYFLKLKDPMLMRAMKKLGPQEVGSVLRTMGNVNRFMSAANTSYAPEFIISNFIRDYQTALLNMQAEQSLGDEGKAKGENISLNLRKVFRSMRAIGKSLRGADAKDPEMAKMQEWYEEYRAAGAQTGYFDRKDIDGQAADIDRLVRMASGGFRGTAAKWGQEVASTVEILNQSVENAVRLAAYISAREGGLTEKQSATLAKNMTVNFNRSGELGTLLNSSYMFANAGIQGISNFARTMLTFKPDEQGLDRLNNAQRIAVGLVGASFAIAALNRAVSGDDEDGENWYDKVPGYVRERNLVIMKAVVTGEQNGEYWKVPLPYGYNIFHVLGDGMESMVGGGRSSQQVATDTTLAFLGSFSPIGFQDSNEGLGALFMRNATPSMFKPVTDLAYNENFMGTQIYQENPPFGTPRPDSSLGRRSTPRAFNWAAQWMNEATGGSPYRSGVVDVNPDTMAYVLDYFMGSAGSFVNRVTDTAQKVSLGVEVEEWQTPFVRRLSGRVLPYGDLNTFYRRRDEIGQIQAELKASRGRDRQRFRAAFGPKVKLIPKVKQTENRLKLLRIRRDRVYEDERLSARERDLKLKDIQGEMETAVDSFNADYAEVEAG